jgi:sulfopyruvate decarboxylase TPP-binding subunit
MLDGPGVVAALVSAGVTHVVWLPDSELGQWENALSTSPDLRLIRVCREGEAMAIAAGLMLGGKRPVVMVQITGFFEAGDALRNVVHDLKLPLFLVIGMRSWKMRDRTFDSCPKFAEPILQAWKLDCTWLDDSSSPEDLIAVYRRAQAAGRAAAVLLPEGSP